MYFVLLKLIFICFKHSAPFFYTLSGPLFNSEGQTRPHETIKCNRQYICVLDSFSCRNTKPRVVFDVMCCFLCCVFFVVVANTNIFLQDNEKY